MERGFAFHHCSWNLQSCCSASRSKLMVHFGCFCYKLKDDDNGKWFVSPVDSHDLKGNSPNPQPYKPFVVYFQESGVLM